MARKQRKQVLREMKALEKRIVGRATAHLTALKTRRHETELSVAHAQQIIDRMEAVLDQLPAHAHSDNFPKHRVSAGWSNERFVEISRKIADSGTSAD